VFLDRTCAVHGPASICIASDARFYWLAKGNPENSGCCSQGGDDVTKGKTPEAGEIPKRRAAAVPSRSGSIRLPVREGVAGSIDSQRAAAGDSRGPILGRPPFSIQNQSLLTSAATPAHACCAADGSVAGTLGRNAQGRGDAPFEKLSTCLALIEIVNYCNLSCPTCYADSPVGTGDHLDAVPLPDLQRRIQGVIDRKGQIEILQLSGGEPTLHPRFFELVEWIQSNPGIDYLLLNTNGVRIAYDVPFSEKLRIAAQHRHFQIYLQFDGPQLESQVALRGVDLRKARLQAIERCREINLPVTLAMTVTPDNLSFLWQAIEFGLSHPHIRGICFQPVFTSGRTGNAGVPAGHATTAPAGTPALPVGVGLPARTPALPVVIELSAGTPALPTTRLNTADILLGAVEQSSGKLRFEDFTPLPCGDPNCATIGYLLKTNGQIHSISEFIDFTKVQGFLQDKVRYSLEDLMRCGCESEPLGALLRQFEMDESNTFRILVKPFMDAWSWDDDRIDRCCTHVIRPDGHLDSFCRYYSGFPDTRSAP
jgi:uncharacterized radical SAM superfamily Fe-S cluster-containing enzyme